MISDRAYAEAVKAGERESAEYGALDVHYDEADNTIVVSLPGDMFLTFPPSRSPGARRRNRSRPEVDPSFALSARVET